jgi:hypothetical protein
MNNKTMIAIVKEAGLHYDGIEADCRVFWKHYHLGSEDEFVNEVMEEYNENEFVESIYFYYVQPIKVIASYKVAGCLTENEL